VNKTTRPYIVRLIFLIFFASAGIDSFGQLHIGPTGGLQAYTPIFKDAVKYEDISSNPGLGFHVGLGMDYNVNKVFSFYTELTYSKRGKYLTGGIRDMFQHKANYQYLEFPVLARLTFKGQIKKRYFKWYVNAGGTLNFWLSGSGYIKSYEYDESNVDRLRYTIKFHEKPENTIDDTFIMYLSEPNKVQAGLVVGGGLLFDINPRHWLMTDLRYTFRQSWLARDHDIDVGLSEYYEDFRSMEHVLSISVAYLFEYNFGQGRRGSSTRGAKIKAKSVGKAPSKKGQNINKIKRNKKRN
jgi:hypothetical protein